MIGADEINDRVVAVLIGSGGVNTKVIAIRDREIERGKIVLELWPDNKKNRMFFFVRYKFPYSDTPKTLAAVHEGLRRMLPSMQYHARSGLYSIHSDEDRVMMNLLERVE